jgi:hypothetical protein
MAYYIDGVPSAVRANLSVLQFEQSASSSRRFRALEVSLGANRRMAGWWAGLETSR